MDVIEKMRKELFRRRYSSRTIATYLDCCRAFIRHNHKDVRLYSKKDIREYLDLLAERGASGSTINVYLQALKFMMENVFGKRVWIDIRHSKTDRKRLPEFLTKEEVTALLGAITNKKHLLMIKLLYGAGLRVSEVINLRIRDLQLEEGYGWVRKGKGNKDRPFIIPACLKDDLLNATAGKDTDNAVFIGHRGRLSIRTVYAIVKRAAKKARIDKNVHPHTLRHSFATHLIENGYAVTAVQSLLGHNSPDTSMIYVHMKPAAMIEVKSPLEELER
ncbi:MAG: tyrosine-type recombinase/integrase [Nanoarchaeota archaeon]|nr:tyrosine-type recombinase/integrase [Nanoarchaeota archaeon]